MRRVVDLAQVLPCDERVDLRRRDARMSEQLLHHPHVGPSLEKMRRERMTQGVQRHVPLDTCDPRRASQHAIATLARQPSTALIQEERSPPEPGSEDRPGANEIGLDRVAAVPTDRYFTLLASLSENTHGSRFEIATGRALSLPAYIPVETYPVRVREDGVVVVEVPDGLPG